MKNNNVKIIVIAAITGVICFGVGRATANTKTNEPAEPVAQELELEEETIDVTEPIEVEFVAGKYIAGEDFAVGKYDIMAVSGAGNVMSPSNINAIMGKDQDREIYTEEYKNATFEEGTQLEVTRSLKIKLIPVN